MRQRRAGNRHAGALEDVLLPVQRQVIEELGHQHLGQQAGGGDALVDDVWRHRGLHQLLATGAGPLATHVAFHREHARLVVQLLGHVLADALHRAAAAAGRALGLVVNIPARQVRGQRLALGGLLVLLALVTAAGPLDLTDGLGDVGVQRLLQQALLLGAQACTELLAGGGELQPLEHGELVSELVHQCLLERHFPRLTGQQFVLDLHLGHQAQQCLAHLLRVQGVELLGGDHRV